MLCCVRETRAIVQKSQLSRNLHQENGSFMIEMNQGFYWERNMSAQDKITNVIATANSAEARAAAAVIIHVRDDLTKDGSSRGDSAAMQYASQVSSSLGMTVSEFENAITCIEYGDNLTRFKSEGASESEAQAIYRNAQKVRTFANTVSSILEYGNNPAVRQEYESEAKRFIEEVGKNRAESFASAVLELNRNARVSVVDDAIWRTPDPRSDGGRDSDGYGGRY